MFRWHTNECTHTRRTTDRARLRDLIELNRRPVDCYGRTVQLLLLMVAVVAVVALCVYQSIVLQMRRRRKRSLSQSGTPHMLQSGAHISGARGVY